MVSKLHQERSWNIDGPDKNDTNMERFDRDENLELKSKFEILEGRDVRNI